MNRNPPRDILLLLAFLFSGITALGLEILWTRLLSLVLGGEVLAVLGVLAGFFGGMVVGALSMNKKVSSSTNPIRTFLILESIIILYGMLSPYLIFGLSDSLPLWLGPISGDNSSILALFFTIFLSGLILIPATFGMGANFAFLIEARRRAYQSSQKLSTSISRLYAANTLGATLGIIVTIYYLMPSYGLENGAIILGFIGILSLISAWMWGSKNQEARLEKKEKNHHLSSNRYLYLLMATGFLTIGLEINAVHILKQILQNTIFTFGNLLAIYLVGTSIGAWLYHKIINSEKFKLLASPGRLFIYQIFSIMLMMVIFQRTENIMHFLADPEGGFLTNIIGEMILAMIVFFIPTIIMGAIFIMLISANGSKKVGKGYGLNILGSTISPFIFGLILIPLIGSYKSIGLIGILYTIIIIIGKFKINWNVNLKTLVPIFLIGFIGLMSFRPSLINIPDGWKIIEYKEGLMGATVVSELPGEKGPFGLPMKVLQVNNRFRMGGGVGFLERRMGGLPLLLQKDIDKALYLGLGTGTTLGMASHSEIGSIDAVEIVPEVKSVLHHFQDHHQGIFSKPNVTYHTSDARRFIRASKEKYDLIVGDLFHPARDGAGLLFTLNHFAYFSDHLTENGLVVQWLPIYQFDEENLKTVIRSFLQVFPRAHAFIGGYNADLPALALVARKQDLKIDFQHLMTTLSPGQPIQSVYENPQDVMASYIAGPEDLKAYAGRGPLNLDQHPIVLFDAPRSVYKKEVEKAQENMEGLLQLRTQFPNELWDNIDAGSINLGARTWMAAGMFMKGNLEKVKSGITGTALDFYVNAYQLNPDFSSARGQLLQVAIQDPNQRKNILNVLNERDRNRLLSIINNQ